MVLLILYSDVTHVILCTNPTPHPPPSLSFLVYIEKIQEAGNDTAVRLVLV